MMQQEPIHPAVPQGNAAASGRRSGRWPLIVGGLVVAYIVILFFRNGQQTRLDFLFFTTLNKTRWLVITSVLIGVALDRVVSMWWRRRRNSSGDPESRQA